MTIIFIISFFFFFNDTATTEIYTLSLHDALPICIIAEDFTFANACIVAEAIARYVVRGEDARKGVIVGYDHRYAADAVARQVAEVFSSMATPVWLTDRPCPTPAVSYLVRERGAAGGVVVTA